MALEKEQQTYERNLETLCGEEGKFVLIQGERIVGTYDSYQDALKAGYEEFGLTPFLVKRISAVEDIQFFTRDPSACRT